MYYMKSLHVLLSLLVHNETIIMVASVTRATSFQTMYN